MGPWLPRAHLYKDVIKALKDGAAAVPAPVAAAPVAVPALPRTLPHAWRPHTRAARSPTLCARSHTLCAQAWGKYKSTTMVLDEARDLHERADSAYNAAMEEKRAAASAW